LIKFLFNVLEIVIHYNHLFIMELIWFLEVFLILLVQKFWKFDIIAFLN
jgi:hypothetical protein